MRSILKASLLVAALAVAVTGCPKVPSKPNMPNRPGGSGTVDPNTCGNYAASDAGRKLKAFFEATVALDKAVHDSENYVRDSCAVMGKELGMTGLDGDTKTVCTNVINELKNSLQVGLKAEAHLNIDYTPAVCTVNVEAAARATAKCEAKAEADIAVKCEGTCTGTCTGGCSGTCNGKCDGTCAGGADSSGEGGGECNGQCDGTCEGSCEGSCSGSCSGGCEGHADVDASAECKAEAEVTASVEAECTEPKLEVSYDAALVVDKAKVDAAVAAIKAGLPQLLLAKAKVEGPLKAAFTTWAASARELAGSANKLAGSFGDQAMCISGQLAAAAKMIAGVQASIDVQVSVSVEASASAGVN